MCLNTYQKKPKKAHKDIKVYKVLEKYYSGGVIKYKAPFYPNFLGNANFYYYEPGKVHKPVREGNEKQYWSIQPDITHPGVIRKVSEGWLHAFIFKMGANQLVDTRNNRFHNNSVVVEMTIPKGAKYYESIDGIEICTDTLVWNE